MGKVIITACVCALMTLAVLSHAVAAGAGTEVILIQGKARVFTKKEPAGRILKKGDHVGADSEVGVAEKSRMALRLPDGSVLRMDENTRVRMSDLAYNPKTEGKTMSLRLAIGKLWAKIRKLKTSDSRVEIHTANAVAGVRGTVYRVNVEKDASALVKVYDGTVYVANPPAAPASEMNKSIAPHEVAGPHAVPPPYHEVSREEWTAIVAAMQQITVSPQGVPSKPQDFDPKADADDWVRWNQELDRKTGF